MGIKRRGKFIAPFGVVPHAGLAPALTLCVALIQPGMPVAVRHMKTHLVGSRSPSAAFLPPSRLGYSARYFRRFTEFIGLVPSGFHGRELPCIVAARRNQTGHRTSNGAPAAAYKIPGSARTDALCLLWVPISRLPGGSACSPPRVESGRMRWRLADPHADPPGIKRPRQHGRLSGQDRRLKTLSQAIFDYNAIIVGNAETMLKFPGPLLHSGASGTNSAFRTPCGPPLLPRKSR